MGFPEGRKAAADGLAALEPGRGWILKGKTALFEAILEGLKLLGSAQPGDVIYVITDGEDNASRSSPRKVEEALVAASARLFWFYLPEPLWHQAPLLPPVELGARENLQELVQHTGGIGLNASIPAKYAGDYKPDEKGRAALSLSIAQLYREMGQFYRLEVELPVPVDKPRDWHLEMVNEHGKKAREWRVAYQSVLLPCNPPTAQKKENN